MSEVPQVFSYDLTEFTGKRRNADRRAVVARYSVSHRDLMLTLAACGAALPITVVAIFVLGFWGFLVLPIAAVIAFYLLGSVSGDKLQITRYRAMDASIGARSGRTLLGRGDRRGVTHLASTIMVAGQPIVAPDIVDVEQLVIPNPYFRREEVLRAESDPRRAPRFGVIPEESE